MRPRVGRRERRGTTRGQKPDDGGGEGRGTRTELFLVLSEKVNGRGGGGFARETLPVMHDARLPLSLLPSRSPSPVVFDFHYLLDTLDTELVAYVCARARERIDT